MKILEDLRNHEPQVGSSRMAVFMLHLLRRRPNRVIHKNIRQSRSVLTSEQVSMVSKPSLLADWGGPAVVYVASPSSFSIVCI